MCTHIWVNIWIEKRNTSDHKGKRNKIKAIIFHMISNVTENILFSSLKYIYSNYVKWDN